MSSMRQKIRIEPDSQPVKKGEKRKYSREIKLRSIVSIEGVLDTLQESLDDLTDCNSGNRKKL